MAMGSTLLPPLVAAFQRSASNSGVFKATPPPVPTAATSPCATAPATSALTAAKAWGAVKDEICQQAVAKGHFQKRVQALFRLGSPGQIREAAWPFDRGFLPSKPRKTDLAQSVVLVCDGTEQTHLKLICRIFAPLNLCAFALNVFLRQCCW